MRRLALIAFALLNCQVALAADVIPPDSAPVPIVIPPDSTPVPVEPPPPAAPPQSGRLTVIEENDALMPAPTDRWYTQGLELRYLTPPLNWNANPFSLPDPSSQQRLEYIFGQVLFTPVNLTLNPPDPKDRPYAGWLYGGIGLYQEYGRQSLDHFEVDLGVVGPAALGEEVQNGFHSLLNGAGRSQYQAAGWDYQLSNEPGLVLSYEHKWRIGTSSGGGLGFDVIPEVGATVGNVYTYGEASAMLRFGQNLNVDYGPARIRPALSGGSWFDPARLDGPFGWYLFVGAQGRAVARDIFLDGNTFGPSPSVEKYPFVGDLSAGASLFWSDRVKVDYIFAVRSKEFVGQSAPDRYGGIDISIKLP